MTKLRVQSSAVSLDGYGAGILGRNKFGPVHGPWPDESWKVGGATIRQYLEAGLVDEMHLALRPMPLGAGERAVHAVQRRRA